MDRTGHLSGVDSHPWRAAISDVDVLLTWLIEGLPTDAGLLVTADHGQLNVPADHRFDVDDDVRPRARVRVLAGEPRARYVHVRTGAGDVPAARRAVLGDAAWVVERDEAVVAGWFGPVPEAHLSRVGDVVAACHDAYAVLASKTDKPLEARGSWRSTARTPRPR